MKRVGVIGGGFGGLASACVLAARGYEVLLFERNGWLGGKAAVLETQGFRFDMGPTILTLPSVLDRIFREAGRDRGEILDLVRLDPQWRSFFDDGSTLDLVANTGQMVEKLSAFCENAKVAEGYRHFMSVAERMHRISDSYFFWKPIGGLRDMFDVRATFQPGIFDDVLAMQPGRTVAGVVRANIPDSRVCQMVDHFTQYVGSAPAASPAVLCGIAHMQTREGIWYPMGGTGAIPEALAGLAESLGVEVRYNVPVKQIIIADGAVRGLRLGDDSEVEVDAVVSNCDSVQTYRHLVGGAAASAFEKRRRMNRPARVSFSTWG